MKVSVLIPTYNRAHLLGRCLESVLAQTHDDLEIIVYDDASTDFTDDVMRSFTDKRISWYRGEENLGDAGARNQLVSKSHCQYAAWQDVDDFSNKYRIEMQLETIRRFKVPICRCYGQRYTEYQKDAWKCRPVFRKGGNRTEPAIMFAVELARQTPYDERIYLGSDIVWELAMAVDHGQGVVLPYMLYEVDYAPEDRLSYQWKNHMEEYTAGVKIKRAEVKRLLAILKKRGVPRYAPRVADEWAKALYGRICDV